MHFADACTTKAKRAGLPFGSDPRWIADEFEAQAIPLRHIPVRAGETATRRARVEGDRLLYLYTDDLRERSWNLFLALAMHRLQHHPLLAESERAAGLLAALIALPNEFVEAEENAHARPRDIHAFVPVLVIEARITACARSGLLVASLA
jgi:hypothetical protein